MLSLKKIESDLKERVRQTSKNLNAFSSCKGADYFATFCKVTSKKKPFTSVLVTPIINMDKLPHLCNNYLKDSQKKYAWAFLQNDIIIIPYIVKAGAHKHNTINLVLFELKSNNALAVKANPKKCSLLSTFSLFSLSKKKARTHPIVDLVEQVLETLLAKDRQQDDLFDWQKHVEWLCNNKELLTSKYEIPQSKPVDSSSHMRNSAAQFRC